MKEHAKRIGTPARDDIDRIVETLVEKPGQRSLEPGQVSARTSRPAIVLDTDVEDIWDNVPV